MEWVETIVPVVYCQLDIRSVRIRDGIGLMSVYSGVEGVVTHRKGGKEGRSRWFAERSTHLGLFSPNADETYTLLKDPRLLPSSYVWSSATVVEFE
jgi:hypothetical protein